MDGGSFTSCARAALPLHATTDNATALATVPYELNNFMDSPFSVFERQNASNTRAAPVRRHHGANFSGPGQPPNPSDVPTSPIALKLHRSSNGRCRDASEQMKIRLQPGDYGDSELNHSKELLYECRTAQRLSSVNAT
ncbi:MAG: hypothetical protein R3D67_07255 [Hyphomicrobiaceae bacterium]